METPAKPPHSLFVGGMDNWHARARLAHFLAMEGIDKTEEALELFHSVVEAEIDEENSEDVEEKVYALQRLSIIERDQKKNDDSLTHINQAIELAESTDFLYKYILRGELWADRWNLLHTMGMTKEAEAEADERIDFYKDIPVDHNSYLYYGYRFKAQLSAERGVTLVAKDYMHMPFTPWRFRQNMKPAWKKLLQLPMTMLRGFSAKWIKQHRIRKNCTGIFDKKAL